ncbi:MAG: histidine kinase, partial [Deltaproteobacteria bacterium]|nr:histidine kinase [Deltaproteobacteria bacterium]
IYRIVQEGLTNIAKHARATAVDVILTYSHPQVMLTIRDNGAGLPVPEDAQESKRKEGIGLVAMRERTLSLGGSFEVSSEQGKGTAIRVEIPV